MDAFPGPKIIDLASKNRSLAMGPAWPLMRPDQGLTKAQLKRDQMALGVFPNCHECQKIDFQVLKKNFGSKVKNENNV